MSKAEIRTGCITGFLFAALSTVIFVLPMLMTGQSTLTISGVLGKKVTVLGPDSDFQMGQFLLLLPVIFTGLFGVFFGIQFRRSRQLQFLGAANPNAPLHLRDRYNLRFWDRVVYRLNSDGTDAQRMPK
ncbi:hypothetical protein [Pseudosulfitobacter sp. SM2401]|uniref:hypothetical protein n=1 Tax=Pseudosulfitobacter sp. SM2401 TaxID=3350098 RepID=UPI0036F2C2FD